MNPLFVKAVFLMLESFDAQSNNLRKHLSSPINDSEKNLSDESSGKKRMSSAALRSSFVQSIATAKTKLLESIQQQHVSTISTGSIKNSDTAVTSTFSEVNAFRAKKVAQKAAKRFDRARSSFVQNLRSIDKLIQLNQETSDESVNSPLVLQQQQINRSAKLAAEKVQADNFATFSTLFLAEMVSGMQKFTAPKDSTFSSSTHLNSRKQTMRDNIPSFLDRSSPYSPSVPTAVFQEVQIYSFQKTLL